MTLFFIMVLASLMVTAVLVLEELQKAGDKICPVSELESDLESPDFVKLVEIVNIGPGFVELKWDMEECETGSPITGYEMEYREYGSTEHWVAADVFPGDVTGGLLAGLDPFKYYEFRVTALHRKGTCLPSDSVYILPPLPPHDVRVLSYEEDAIGLGWEPPENDGGMKVTEYLVMVKDRADRRADWQEGVHAPPANLTAVQHTERDPVLYEYLVLARNAVGFSEPSEEVFADRAQPPRSPVITRYDNDSRLVELEWHSPVNESYARTLHYTVYYRVVGGEQWTRPGHVVPAPLLSAAVQLPAADTSVVYEFAVTATNVVGESAPSDTVVADKSDPPRNLRLVEVGDDSVIVQWDPPQRDGGQPVTEYLVLYSLREDNTTMPKTKTVPGSSTRVELRALTALQAHRGGYKVVVSAFNVAGLSEMSEILSFGVPDPPEDVRITAVDRKLNFMTVAWRQPEYVGGDTLKIDKYSIEFKKKGEKEPWREGLEVTKPNVFRVKQQGLDFHAGVNYELRMFAENMVGRSKPSAVVSADVPSPPRNLEITHMNKEQGEVELVWESPEFDYNIPIKGYSVQYKVKDDRDDDNWEERYLEGNRLAYNFNDLRKNVTYIFRVKAENMIGFSESSNTDLIEKSTPPLDFQIKVLDRNQGSGYFSWKEPENNGGREIKEYILQFREHNSSDAHWTEITESAKNIFNKDMIYHHIPKIWPLKHGALLEFRLIAVNQAGRSEPSNIAFIDLPSPPTNVDVISMDPEKGTAKLSWSPPLNNGGSEIVEYVIEYRRRGAVTWEERRVIVPGNKLRETVTDLHDLDIAEYEFRVRASNIAGTSPDTHPPAAAGKPDPPEEFRIVKINNPQTPKGSIELKWSPPRRDGGKPILDYSLEYAEIDSDTWSRGEVVPHTDIKSRLHVEQKLDLRDKFYKFRLRARNMAGYGSFTAPIKIDPPGAPQHLDIKNMDIARNFVELTWQAPERVKGTGEATGYVIEYKIKGTKEWTIGDSEIDKNGLSGKLHNLDKLSEFEYEFQVRAQNMAGRGPPSAPVSVSRPGPPTDLQVIKNDSPDGEETSVEIKWNSPGEDGGRPVLGYNVQYDDGTGSWSRGEDIDAHTLPSDVPYKLKLKGTIKGFRVRARNMAGYGTFSEPVFTEK